MDWQELYARICAQTGWTWEYVGQNMTLPRLKALNKYWQDNHHVRQLSALLGSLGSASAPAASPPEEGGLADLINDFQAAGGRTE